MAEVSGYVVLNSPNIIMYVSVDSATVELHLQPKTLVRSPSNGWRCRQLFVSMCVCFGKDLAGPGPGVLPPAAVAAGSSLERPLPHIVLLSYSSSPPIFLTWIVSLLRYHFGYWARVSYCMKILMKCVTVDGIDKTTRE